MADNSHRGHPIHYVEGVGWVYADTGCLVREERNRMCGVCGESNTIEGHDACIGSLPGVSNACCGHGWIGDAYVQFEDGRCIRGAEARDWPRLNRCERS
jgi:hypothetical protein